MANPDLLPGFDTNDTNTSEPSTALKEDGYSFNQIVTSKNLNFLLKQLFDAANKSANSGIWDWEDPATSDREYNTGSVVRHNGALWESSADSNTDEPGVGADWGSVTFDGIATDTVTNKAGAGPTDFPYGATGVVTSTSEVNTEGQNWSGVSYADPDAVGANPTAKIYPDGTVVGSTDNGYYTKYPNGQLVCRNMSSTLLTTVNLVSPLYYVNQLQDFPVAFVSTSDLRVEAIDNAQSGIFWASSQILVHTTTQAKLRANGGSNTASGYVGYIAQGRWK